MAAGVGRVQAKAGIAAGRGLLGGMLEKPQPKTSILPARFPGFRWRGKDGCYMGLPCAQYNQPWPSPPQYVTLPLISNRGKGGFIQWLQPGKSGRAN